MTHLILGFCQGPHPVIFRISKVQVGGTPGLPVAFHALNALRFRATSMTGYVTGAMRHVHNLDYNIL